MVDSIKEISFMTNFTAPASMYQVTKSLSTKENFLNICYTGMVHKLPWPKAINTQETSKTTKNKDSA